MKIFVVNAFSKNNKGGNKAGICFLEKELDKNEKLKIAKKVNFSETVFISGKNLNNTDFRLEYFTPNKEIELCGHATIGAFLLMQEKCHLKNGSYKIQTKDAVLEVILQDNTVFMEQNKPIFGEVLAIDDIKKTFNESVIRDLPIQIVSTGLRDIMLPIVNIKTLNQLKPNFEKIKIISKKLKIVSIHAFAIEKKRIVCRNFAPLYGILEESATGSSNSALASYLYHHNILKKNKYKFEQGYALGSLSEIIVKLKTDNNEIRKVFVGGTGHIDFIDGREYINYVSQRA
ncbi:MAG: PhzF family phenazine biosynthesis protein [Clostridiales Family XIII bacterium]|jgi:PhzF family phenazine biosynthesis protein|nr:PhzF family phenazine biosynthesis protein [Clostridiales Family XIII bacterium]